MRDPQPSETAAARKVRRAVCLVETDTSLPWLTNKFVCIRLTENVSSYKGSAFIYCCVVCNLKK